MKEESKFTPVDQLHLMKGFEFIIPPVCRFKKGRKS